MSILAFAGLQSLASAQMTRAESVETYGSDMFIPNNTEILEQPTKTFNEFIERDDTRTQIDTKPHYTVIPRAFLCELSDIKGYCTWFSFATEYCYNFRPGDINSAAGLAENGMNKIRSVVANSNNDCRLYADKDCKMELLNTYVSPNERKLDLGLLNDHVQSIYCATQKRVCKMPDGTKRPYEPAPLPAGCTPFKNNNAPIGNYA